MKKEGTARSVRAIAATWKNHADAMWKMLVFRAIMLQRQQVNQSNG
jgi:hypothetical protein